MTSTTLPQKQSLRDRRNALKHEQRQMRIVMKAKMKQELAALKATPMFVAAAQKRKRRRQRNTLIALIIVLLLLLLSRCECDPVEDEGPAGPDAAVVVVDTPEIVPEALTSGKGRTQKTKRPALKVEPPPPPPWLDQFRLQVAARSPRLATCLNGNERPGAMRLSGLVHAKSGRVTAAVVEPVFRGSSLSERQLECLVKELTTQSYRLDEPNPSAAARRVSLIFEF